MKNTLQLVLFFLFFVTTINNVVEAQIYSVQNALHAGIEGVFIRDEHGESTITDKQGNFELFGNGKRLTFSHVNFKTVTVSRDHINRYFVIYLDEKIIPLDEIVVGANKWEEKSYENPQQVRSIKSVAIANDMPRTTADLIGNTGEVFIQKSQMGGGSPMIRGFAANQILLVVDGVRMNNAIYRSGNLQNILSVDPNSVEHAEIIFGPGSVIYGSDALGGVIDFHTRTPKLSDNELVTLHGDAAIRLASATGEGTGAIHLDAGNNKWSWHGGFTYSSFEDLNSGKWYKSNSDRFGQRKFVVVTKNGVDQIQSNFHELEKQTPTSYEQVSTQQKVRFKPNEFVDIQYSFLFTNTSNVPRYDRLTELNPLKDDEGKNINVTSEDVISIDNNLLETTYGSTTPKFSQWYYGPQLWMLNALKLKLSKPNRLYNDFKLTFSQQFVKEDRHNRKFNDELRNNDYVDVNIWALNLDLLKKMNDKFELAYGFEGTTNKVNARAETYNILTGAKNNALPRYAGGGSYYSTLGLYGVGKYRINKKLIASLGLRYSHTFISSDYTDQASEQLNLPYDHFNYDVGSLTGSLGLSYQNEDWLLKTQFAKGFKAPNIDDIGKVYNPSKDDLVVPNSNLKPTDVYTIDATIEKRWDDIFQVGLTGFYSWLHNAMVRGPYQFNGQDSIVIDGDKYAVFALQNTGKARIAGVSLQLKANLSQNLTLQGAYTYTTGEDEVTGDRLRHVPPGFGKLEIIYSRNRWHVGLNTFYSGGIDFQDLAPSEQEKPYLYAHEGALSWWTLNFQSSIRLRDFAELHFNVENILDQSYRTYSSGINAPGRNVTFGMRGFF
ncbi:TonB-dependent receptor domain-containing protein [Flammeovirga sp. OC4]|uniref:TonB-dependent receptor n=1 Tax=Flammeovirga sp. OC4 TaxID=1382345 RepID=UPI0005C4D5F7|nr:TonB-dependent receptor [Flammeovirga sp. OC4]